MKHITYTEILSKATMPDVINALAGMNHSQRYDFFVHLTSAMEERLGDVANEYLEAAYDDDDLEHHNFCISKRNEVLRFVRELRCCFKDDDMEGL